MARKILLFFLFGVVVWAQTGVHEHALAGIGPEKFAVSRGMHVEIYCVSNLARPERVLSAPQRLEGVASLSASPDGHFLAAGGDWGRVAVWDLAAGTVLYEVKLHTFKVWTVAFSPDGSLLASGAFDGTVKIFDLRAGLEAGVFVDPELRSTENPEGTAHTGWVRCVAFSPDGKYVATSGCDGYVRIWDVQTLRLVQKIRGGINVYSVAFSSDGKYLAWGNNPGEVRLATVGDWKEVRVIPVKNPAFCVAFSLSGRYLAAAGHQKILWVWDVASGTLVRQFSGHEGRIWGLCFLTETRLVTTGEDGTFRVWELGI
ncbi:WD40 repeat domain-containing protein [Candidatus Bipolaricaulota bacterium]|nr:WD40 repeat domain-containing protein [Candidatus Bipolaricaulota bacterium]